MGIEIKNPVLLANARKDEGRLVLPPYFTDSSHCLPQWVLYLTSYPGMLTVAIRRSLLSFQQIRPVRCEAPGGIHPAVTLTPLINRLLSVGHGAELLVPFIAFRFLII